MRPWADRQQGAAEGLAVRPHEPPGTVLVDRGELCLRGGKIKRRDNWVERQKERGEGQREAREMKGLRSAAGLSTRVCVSSLPWAGASLTQRHTAHFSLVDGPRVGTQLVHGFGVRWLVIAIYGLPPLFMVGQGAS